MTEARRYSSPKALSDAITDRVRSAVQREADERTFATTEEFHRFSSSRPSQLRCDIAMQRFVARLETLTPGRWVIKGGVALHIRLDPSRPSLDLDLVDTEVPVQHELQIRDLEAAARIDLDDHFRFELDRTTADTDEHGSTTINITTSIGGASFESFDVDLAPAGAVSDSESSPLRLPIPLELSCSTVEVQILRLEPQLAEKICAMFELHGRHRGHSSRWRDLADIAMVATQSERISAHSLLEHLSRESGRRPMLPDEGLPTSLALPVEQVEDWRRSWGGRGRTVPLGLNEALEVADRFISPLLDGSASGTWDPHITAWVSYRHPSPA